MDILILIVVMLVVGWIMARVSGMIWKDDLLESGTVMTASLVTAVVVGLLDWFVIPAIGFSDTLKYIGVVLEPPLSVLLVVWILRKAKS